MDFHGLDRARATGNCDSLAVGLVGRDIRGLCPWNRVHPGHVLDLLDQAGPEARAEARNLARLLAGFRWRIHGGSPPASAGNRLVSNAREIVVAVAGRTFHLHCIASPSLRVERITS